MKRVMTLVLAGMMILSMSAVAASGDEVGVMPVLISVEAKSFTIEQDGSDIFTIVVSENASTGYMWTYTIKDEALVEMISDERIEPAEPMPGAPSQRRMTFKTLANGVSTITFKYARPFGDEEVAEEFIILAYKTDQTVIIEEDQLVYAMDQVQPTLYTTGETVTYKGTPVIADVPVQEIDGITMVPLRATLEAMDYTVTWNNDTRSVEILKGPQWTSIAIGKNAYFRNRMAPHELSAAPVIVDSRTLVPLEFFADIIGKSIEVSTRQINMTDFEAVIHRGYIKNISYDETGMKTLTLTSDMSSDAIDLQTIIHTSNAYTFYQKDVKEGDMVQVVASMIMTASIPGQTSGYVVY